jgi:transposase
MQSFLTNKQRNEYKLLHRKCKDKHFADRIKSILALDRGHSFEEIAEWLMIDDTSVRRWYEQFNAVGIEELMKDDYRGSEPYLKKKQQDKLVAYLERNICLSAKEVCHYVKKQYGVEYTTKGITHLLHRLGFVYKKPKHLPSKADREAQEEFIKHYEELKENKKSKDKIYFMDGTHPMHNSQLAYGWIKKGKEKFVKANTGRERININGAYNIEEHKVIVREDESINAQSTVALLKQMLVQQPTGKLYIILDNARYYHSQIVHEFLSKNKRIQFIYLPPYSPNLNIIERLWKFMKKKTTYDKYYEKFSVFRKKVLEFFENIKNYREELESLMTENFQLFPT